MARVGLVTRFFLKTHFAFSVIIVGIWEEFHGAILHLWDMQNEDDTSYFL
jgi:hypothetical protein